MGLASESTTSRVSVVILTYNEELNLPHALKSVQGWSDDVHVVDSGSTDETVAIARKWNAQIHHHPWKDWADQRNWTLDSCPIKYEWVLFLDADEQLTAAARRDITEQTRQAPADCVGFHLAFDFFFLNRRVRNAMHPHLRLVKRDTVRWRVQGAREYCSAPGDSPRIRSRLIHFDHRGIGFWIEKQSRNARLEALALVEKRRTGARAGDSHPASGDRVSAQGERRLRHRLRNLVDRVCPPLVRPFLFFAYRLFFKTDLRDGYAGLAYAFFFGLWYPMLIDARYLELVVKEEKPPAP
jgi:glycosyltransferase involved in cell wall biosynthesis